MLKVAIAVLFAAVCGCQATSQSARGRAAEALAGEWTGVMVHEGWELPVAIEFTVPAGGEYTGTYRTLSTAPLRATLVNIRVDDAAARFEVAGGLVFEGRIVGSRLTGTVCMPDGKGEGFLVLRRREESLPIEG